MGRQMAMWSQSTGRRRCRPSRAWPLDAVTIHRGLRLLLVEDQALVATMLEDQLIDLGCKAQARKPVGLGAGIA